MLSSTLVLVFSAWPTLAKIQTDLNSSLPLLSLRKSFPSCFDRPLADISIRWLDGRHVVFGEVLEGMDVVTKIENCEKAQGDAPKKEIKVAKSGEIPVPAEGIHAEL